MAETHSKLLFLAAEPSYAGAVALAQAIPCRVRDYNPWVANMRQKANIQNHKGAQKSNTLDSFMSITVEIDLAGSGEAGTAPLFADLFKACGYSVTLTLAVDTVIALDGGATDSLAIGLHVDNVFFKMVGVRGSGSYQHNAAGMPMFVAELWGIPQAVTNTPMPAVPDLSAFQEPVSLNDANTTFTVWGYAGILSSMSISDNHEIIRRDKPNDKSVRLGPRNVGGQIQFVLPDIASKDFLALIKNDTVDEVSLAYGLAAGNIITHALPQVQLTSPTMSEEDDELHVSATMIVMPTAGASDDEHTITLT